MEPTDSSAFEYINVDYAVGACKWSKFHSLAARIAASVLEEDIHRNLPSRKSIKRARQKARKLKLSQTDQQPHQDGYWRKQVQLANNVTLHNTLLQSYMDYHACTALDLNRPAHSRDQIKSCGKKHTEKKLCVSWNLKLGALFTHMKCQEIELRHTTTLN